MVPNSIIDLPHVDENGYFDGLCACMVDATGELLLGANTFNIPAPEDDGKHFYRITADKTGWEAEAIPTTAEECIGIVIDHQSQTDRVHRLRACFDALTKDSTEFRQVQNPETNALTVERIPEKTLEEVRRSKLSELDVAFLRWYEREAVVTSSLGFVADSDSRAMMDVSGLVTTLESAPEGARSTVAFMDHDNQPHRVTLDQLKTLRREIAQNGQSGYAQKWAFRSAIESAEDIEALKAMTFTFTGEDFSGSTDAS